jgi:hypothetical protein
MTKAALSAGSVMTTASEFRKRAKDCMDMAPKLRPESRQLMMTIAEAWLVLAHAEDKRTPVEQAHKLEDAHDSVH